MNLLEEFTKARANISIRQIMDRGEDFDSILADYEKKYGKYKLYRVSGYMNKGEE